MQINVSRHMLKILFLLFADVATVILAGLMSMQNLLDKNIISMFPVAWFTLLRILPFWIPTHIAVLVLFKLYNRLWAYASINEVIRIAAATFCVTVLLIPITLVLHVVVNQSWYVFIWLITTIFTIGSRFLLRIGKTVIRIITSNSSQKSPRKNIMIIGAGDAGSSLLRDISRDKHLDNIKAVCVIDDDKSKQNKYICGVKVVGGRDRVEWAAEKYAVDDIVFAIPSADAKARREIFEICKRTHCALKTLPNLAQLLNSTVSFSMLKKVDIEDLLGRPQITLELNEIRNHVRGKRVLVTGAGGSIGSELCRQVAFYEPALLIMLDIYENSIYFISEELKAIHPDLEVVTLIGSIRDTDRLENLFCAYRPQIVYHAAAHKHVPLMEASPNESVKNNVIGTLNTVRAAEKFGVTRFVMISTDKAVNPTSIMGATKRICEMIIQAFDRISKTEFVAVRFGNVLGSNGSVIPIFEKQIAEGGPVTVTHPEIFRYFMTISEAVSLVLQAGAFARGGEIFTLDMGEPVKILSLAENMIRLSGKEPYRDIGIEFTGLRSGEKLYEELLMAEEGLMSTKNDKIFICKPLDINLTDLISQLNILSSAVNDESRDIRALVKEIVPTYKLPQEALSERHEESGNEAIPNVISTKDLQLGEQKLAPA